MRKQTTKRDLHEYATETYIYKKIYIYTNLTSKSDLYKYAKEIYMCENNLSEKDQGQKTIRIPTKDVHKYVKETYQNENDLYYYNL